LLQAKTPISSDDTAGTLHDRLAQMGAELILSTLQGLSEGTLQGKMQDETQVTYASKLTKEMEWLDPREEAQVLDRKIRALNPWPGTSLNLGERLKVKKAQLRQDIQGPVGKIFERSGMLLLGTPQGSIELQKVQWDGKKRSRCFWFY